MFCFALLFGIALYCTVWTIYLAVPHTLQGWKQFDELLKQSGFRDIALSIASTYGLYILLSILHYDPWHLLTCFIQYMFLLPSKCKVACLAASMCAR
jgi:chitin synthase